MKSTENSVCARCLECCGPASTQDSNPESFYLYSLSWLTGIIDNGREKMVLTTEFLAYVELSSALGRSSQSVVFDTLQSSVAQILLSIQLCLRFYWTVAPASGQGEDCNFQSNSLLRVSIVMMHVSTWKSILKCKGAVTVYQCPLSCKVELIRVLSRMFLN